MKLWDKLDREHNFLSSTRAPFSHNDREISHPLYYICNERVILSQDSVTRTFSSAVIARNARAYERRGGERVAKKARRRCDASRWRHNIAMFTARIATWQFTSPRMLDRFIHVIREMTTRREINELLLRREKCDASFLWNTRVVLIISRSIKCTATWDLLCVSYNGTWTQIWNTRSTGFRYHSC